MRISLRVRIFVLVCILVTAFVGAISLVLHQDLRNRLHENFRVRGSIIAEYFTRNSVEGITIEDEQGLSDAIDRLFEIDDIVYAGIYDSDQTKIVAQSSLCVDDNLGYPTNEIRSQVVTHSVKVSPERTVPVLDFKIAAVDEHDEIVGWTRVGFSLERIDAELHRMTARSKLLLSLFVGIALLLGFLVASSIANPINEIAHAINAFGEGDWSQTVNTKRADEVGQLASGFNKMARNLQSRTEELQRSKEALATQAEALRNAHDEAEKRVQERTAELAAANADLRTQVFEREQAQQDLRKTMDELAIHNLAMTGREKRILELKIQINELLEEMGRSRKYGEQDNTTVELRELLQLGADDPAWIDPNSVLKEISKQQGVLDCFCESVGVAAAVVDLEGRVLIGAGWKRICMDFHRANPKTCHKCIESDTILANEMRDGYHHSVYSCKNGLTDAASPIIVEGQHVANMFVGQFLLEPPNEQFFRKQAEEYGFDPEDYLAALREVPIVDHDKLQVILAFLREFAALIGSMEVGRSTLSKVNADLRSNRQALLSLMEDLIDAREKAEDASRSKSEFLANMSHEIRTPMTAILGFADMLLEFGDLENAPPERIEAARTIKKNGEYLIGIINDILDLSKVEAGKMTIERVSCCPCILIADVTSLVKVKADGRGLSFQTEFTGPIPQRIETDPTRLRQILINLIGNAIKFTEVGGVKLVVSCQRYNGSPLMQFDVVDTGIGMSDEQVQRLFHPFTQADTSTTRRFGGTGLGLAISKRFAEILGGDITVVETAEGLGTRFRATISTGTLDGVEMIHPTGFDAAVDAEQKRETCNEVPIDLTGIQVLLTEDGPDNQRLISFILQRAGANVTVMENGKLAIDATLRAIEEGQPFDVILMDMQMPVMDGYQATETLREYGHSGPIIALTAHAMEGDRVKCIEVGCDDYATKPIDREFLIKTIHSHLKRVASSKT